MDWQKRWLAILILAWSGLLAACARVEPGGATRVVVYITATPGPSATSSSTPTITSTPTPTPTPTATAPPVLVFGDPRAALVASPVPQGGAPCGLVDILDFPLDPPDAERARGGRDFGVYRSRYDKFHTGEDWGLASRANFGAPVYSIGHGQVTYAEPLGWGADQGVVIVRHTLPEGRTVLSFYGHLDPPSIRIRAGACVARGEQVGEIGRPRGFPHLHFEIRTQMPDLPGPGYWPVDPTRAGWLPPSRFIWEKRMGASPGVIWVGGADAPLESGLGVLDSDTFFALSGRRLAGIDLATGGVRWTLAADEPIEAALLDPQLRVLYALTLPGDLIAYNWPAGAAPANGVYDEAALDRRWTLELENRGTAELLPAPDGGVIVAHSRALAAVSPAGELRWQQEIASPLQEWARWGELLVFTLRDADAGLWAVGDGAPVRLAAGISGLPARGGAGGYLYTPEGIYHWRGAGAPLERLYPLPPAFPAPGDLVALPGGQLLLAHMDRADRRLVSFGPEGMLRWERSVAALPQGRLRLAISAGRAFLLVIDSDSPTFQVHVYAVNLGSGDLFHLFTGGSRAASADEIWLSPLAEGPLLVHLGGGSLVVLDPAAAAAGLSPQ